MDDLISRRQAIEAMGKAMWAKERLEELPSAQPEIIRCKDCKHKHVENMIWTCPFGLSGGENFFCGFVRTAERTCARREKDE